MKDERNQVMAKKYQQPQIQVISIAIQSSLLAGSPTGSTTMGIDQTKETSTVW